MAHECAIFEAVHGSAPDIAGKDMANPTALLQTAVLMLHHINERATAERVQAGIEQVYREGKTLTQAMWAGTSGTKAFADAVLEAMEAPVALQSTDQNRKTSAGVSPLAAKHAPSVEMTIIMSMVIQCQAASRVGESSDLGSECMGGFAVGMQALLAAR